MIARRILLGIGLIVCAGVWGQEANLGYRGIWYSNQKLDSEYVYKYSGGLGTYCAKHIPMAVFSPEAQKTFFVYGGAKGGFTRLAEMVGMYDHRTGQVARPVELMDKGTGDAHDNPVLALDKQGYLWIFASAHGTARPAFIFRGQKPYDISAFDQVLETNFSYPQPWYDPDRGFLLLHTYYKGGRGLYWQTSPDGRTWSERTLLSHVEEGHYQVSWPCFAEDNRTTTKVGTAFNYHPTAFQGDAGRRGLNWRTNLFYVETPDFGQTWRTAAGEAIAPPLKEAVNPALLHDYQAEGLLVYVKDLKFDQDGHPVILHLTSRGWAPGPENDPRTWRTAHWTGSEWAFHTITQSDNNYDTGCLSIEPDGRWLVLGPTETGPQPYNPGGEMALWESRDSGRTWTRLRVLTANSPRNHGYARSPLHRDLGFFTFWADGHGRQPSESRLYFYDAKADTVYRLPADMTEDHAAPEPLARP